MKTKRTVEAELRIIEALKAGNTRRAAADYAGIHEHTLGEWVKKYPDFAESVAKAESDAEIRNVAIIQRAAANTWQAAAWWLERRRPADFRVRNELTGAEGGPVKVVVEYAQEAKPNA